MSTWTAPNAQITIEASADLSAKQYFLVKDNGSGLAALAAAGTDAGLGILQNKPKSGQGALIMNGGACKVQSAATPLTDGQNITSDAAGKAVVTTTDKDYVYGRVVGDWGANEVVEVIACVPFTLSAT